MKKLTLFFFIVFSTTLFSQQIDYNEQKKFVASGYDVVSYFSNKAQKGISKFTFIHDNANYKFSSKENLEIFKNDPEKYIPQFGGWCAYAMSTKAEKVAINPKTFEIRDGKLYLFYDAFFTNTFEDWLVEMPNDLIKKGTINWNKLKYLD